MTLCRVKNVENKETVIRNVEEIEFEEKILIESVQLIKSELTSSGPIYSVVHESKLGTR